MRKHLFIVTATALLVPLVALAAVVDVFDAENLVIDILGKLGYLFWVLSLAAFFLGLVKFISNARDSEAHEKGKHLMIWGIISFFVLVSLWGIVSLILDDTVGLPSSSVNYVDKNGNPI